MFSSGTPVSIEMVDRRAAASSWVGFVSASMSMLVSTTARSDTVGAKVGALERGDSVEYEKEKGLPGVGVMMVPSDTVGAKVGALERSDSVEYEKEMGLPGVGGMMVPMIVGAGEASSTIAEAAVGAGVSDGGEENEKENEGSATVDRAANKRVRSRGSARKRMVSRCRERSDKRFLEASDSSGKLFSSNSDKLRPVGRSLSR